MGTEENSYPGKAVLHQITLNKATGHLWASGYYYNDSANSAVYIAIRKNGL